MIRFARATLSCLGWIPRIPRGPGRGLRFDGGSSAAVFLSGEYELPVQESLALLLNPGNVFYDVGANAGFFSVLAARLVGPEGAVYSLEPVPENASRVERNARLNHMRNIEALRVAASDRTGKADLLLARYAGGAVLKGAGIPPDFTGSILVETTTIDDLVRLGKVRTPDVVKIDVEGAEVDVLRGMTETLRRWAPKLIIEVDDAVEARCMEKLATCQSLVQDLGYRVEVLPNAYRDGKWFVRHLVARHSRGRGASVEPCGCVYDDANSVCSSTF